MKNKEKNTFGKFENAGAVRGRHGREKDPRLRHVHNSRFTTRSHAKVIPRKNLIGFTSYY
jgi:hypothetical protein